jgi:hypothetical protein
MEILMPEKQAVLRICENRIIKKQVLEKPGFFIRNPIGFEAFYYLKNYLQLIKPFSKSTYFLPIYDRFAMPVSPYQNSYYSNAEVVDMIDQSKVCKEARALSTMQTSTEQAKNRFGDYMAISVMGIVILLIIVVLLAAAGKLDISTLGW